MTNYSCKGGAKAVLGRDHQIVTIAIVETSLVALQSTPTLSHLRNDAILLGCAWAGSLLPDIDSATSTINQMLPISLSRFFHHRGITHSLLGLILFASLMYWLMHGLLPAWMPVYLGLLIGYFLHLLEDSFSQAGVRWLAPLSSYDRWAYENYHVYLCQPVRFKKRRGKKIPVRHWWGRGYKVGGNFETFLRWVAVFMISIATIILLVRYLAP